MALRKGLSLGISYPRPQALAAFPGKVALVVRSLHTARLPSRDGGCPLLSLALPGSLRLVQLGTKGSLLEPHTSDVSVQDRDTEVQAEVEEGTGDDESWGVGEVRASRGMPRRLSRGAVSKEQALARGLAWP